MESVGEMLRSVRRMRKRQVFQSALNFGLIIASALAIWKGMMVVTGSESPIVVILSGSMEPSMARGDLLFLTKDRGAPLSVGDIIVYNINQKKIPIVHRILDTHEESSGDLKILTKGDHNPGNDRPIYQEGWNSRSRQLPPKWLHKDNVIGKAVAFMPYAGVVTILMNDYPWLKFALIAVIGFFVLVNRE